MAELGTVTLTVGPRDDVSERVRGAFAGVAQGSRITFPSVDLLWKVLGPKRLAVLRTMAGQGPLSIREVARRVDRDVKSVHGDVRALLEAGLLEEGEGGVRFPHTAIHVDFTLRAA